MSRKPWRGFGLRPEEALPARAPPEPVIQDYIIESVLEDCQYLHEAVADAGGPVAPNRPLRLGCILVDRMILFLGALSLLPGALSSPTTKSRFRRCLPWTAVRAIVYHRER